MVSPDPIGTYMEILTSIVHREYLTSIIEKETDLKLIPTYCLTRKYFQGSILDSHTDRDASEISLTYCISGPEWEINMGDNTLITKIGNGVIYKGCELPHGRSKPSSGEVIQVFNHWVILDGAKSKNAYDNNEKNKDFYLRGLAHLGEHFFYTEKVAGSIPVTPTKRASYNGITSDFQSDDFSSILNVRSTLM